MGRPVNVRAEKAQNEDTIPVSNAGTRTVKNGETDIPQQPHHSILKRVRASNELLRIDHLRSIRIDQPTTVR
jgi:hypothetical protein